MRLTFWVKFSLIITFIKLNLCANAQFSQNEDNQIVIGSVDSLYSNILDEQREILIHLPEEMDSTKKYPVIYLLDGPVHFYTVTGILKLLTQWNMPESILVSITNTDRIRDLTPTNVPFQRGHNSETSGGALAFIEFIQKELQPYINSKYSTENINTIIGHSTGGLFVIYAYVHHPDVFDNYLAIDPSLWWDKEKLVEQSKDILNKGNHKEKPLYVAVANSAEADTVSVRKDTTEHTEQLRANLNFQDILVKNDKYLNFNWVYNGNEDHGSIVIPGLNNGLRALFSWYPFPEMWRFNTPDQYTKEELIEPFYSHYSELSKRLKREVKPDWQLLNDVGFFMLSGHNLPEKALAYLEMNLKYYPDESKTYVALGNFFTMQNNKDLAIEYFKKAIEIDDNKEAQAKLEELYGGK